MTVLAGWASRNRFLQRERVLARAGAQDNCDLAEALKLDKAGGREDVP